MAIGTVVVLAVGTVGAQDGTGVVIVDDTVIVDAAYPGTLTITERPGVPYEGPRLWCAYFALVVGGPTVVDVVPVEPEVGETYLWFCWEPGRHPIREPYSPTYPVVVTYSPTVNPPGEVLTAADAAQYAINRIRFRSPEAALSPADRQIVGVPTWLAVTSQLDYDPVSAQAGPVWATVRPEFRAVTWRFGNGDELVCTDDATTVWRPHDPDQTSACTHTFSTSGREPYRGSVEVSWTIWHRTHLDPTDWTVFGEVSLSAPVAFPVTELQAVVN